MLRILTLAPVFALLGAGTASAALSGYYDSLAQIEAVLSASELGDALRQWPVEKIEFEGQAPDGALIWEVESGDCEIAVALTATPPAGVGATTYAVSRIGPCR